MKTVYLLPPGLSADCSAAARNRRRRRSSQPLMMNRSSRFSRAGDLVPKLPTRNTSLLEDLYRPPSPYQRRTSRLAHQSQSGCHQASS